MKKQTAWTDERKAKLMAGEDFCKRKLSLREGVPFALSILPNPLDPRLEIPYVGNSREDSFYSSSADFVVPLEPVDTFSRAQVLRGIALLQELQKEKGLDFPNNSVDCCFINHGSVSKYCSGRNFLNIYINVVPNYVLSFSMDKIDEGMRYSAEFGRELTPPFMEKLARRHLG